MTRPKVEVDVASFARAAEGIIDQVGIQTQDEAEEIGKAMVQEVEQIVKGLFSNDNHKPNTTHIENSFKYEVSRVGDNGWTVALTIKPGVSSGKIGALNYGRDGTSKSYVILPRNVPRALEFKGTGVDFSYASGKGGYAGRVLRPYAVRQSAGASKGYGFMEEARRNVLERFGYGDLV